MKGFDWNMQARFDHLSDEELEGPAYLGRILATMDLMAGERIGDEERRAVRAALYEGMRGRD